MSHIHLWQWAAAHSQIAAATGAVLLAQSTVLIALGLLAARIAGQRSSAMKSAVLRAVLLAVFICPIAGGVLHRAGVEGVRLRSIIRLPNTVGIAWPQSGFITRNFTNDAGSEVLRRAGSDVEESGSSEYLRTGVHVMKPRLIAIALAVLVSLFLLTRLTIAMRLVRRIRRGAASAPSNWIEDAGRFARVFRVTPPPVLLTDYFNTPCLVGCAAPAILLPKGSGSLRPEVLVHELAHVRRNDCLWHLLARAAAALLWFQPLMWVLARRLEQASDEACDDFVVDYGSDRADYAHQLVDMAERHQASWVHCGGAVGMAAMKSTVARRVVRIMAGSRGASAGARHATVLLATLVFGVGAIVATLLQPGDSAIAADVAAAAPPRLPVPDVATLAKAEKLVRDAFGNYSATPLKDRPAMAAKMIQGGIDTQGNDAGRYALLKDGMDLAAGAGDAADAMTAVDELSRIYAVNRDELRLESIRKASLAATTPAAAQSVAQIGLKCADDSVDAGDYETAMKFLAPIETAAHRISPAVASIETHAGEIRWMHQESMHAKLAEAKRAKTPDDPDSSFAIGRFLCLVKMDWKRGLPELLKGSNPAFRAAAANDLSAPTHYDKQVAAGDLWWDLAEKETNGAQSALRRRAAYWYKQAVADPQFAGLLRVLTEKRLASAPPPTPEQAMAETTPQPSAPMPPTSTVPSPAAASNSVFSPSKTGAKNILLFLGNPKEEALFKGIGAEVHVVKPSDTIAMMANPQTYAQSNVIVWGRNSMVIPSETSFTDANWEKMRHFMEVGGDLILFEQSGGNPETGRQLKANWSYIEKTFGIKMGGGAITGASLNADILPYTPSDVQTGEFLAKVVFFNDYTALPANATVLVSGRTNHNHAVVAGVPVGKGRLILIGTNLSPADEPLDRVIIQYIYAKRSATAGSPRPGGNIFTDEPTPAPAAGAWPNATTNTIDMKFVRIEAGEFDMGSPPTEKGHDIVETLHHVKITKPFMMATTTVTQAQWNAIMGKNSSDFPGDNHPVDKVSWDDAVAFCEKLGAKEGKHYRLPTEAEFEYACRAGTQSAYSFGDGNIDDYAWYDANSGQHTHDVATKKPNRWGLYDMNGNLWQWCSDAYEHYHGDAIDPQGGDDPSLRVTRGGSWNYNASNCRAAYRSKSPRAFRINLIGFRVCTDADQNAGVAATPAPAVTTSPSDVLRMDTPWKNIWNGERYILKSDQTGEIISPNGKPWTTFTWAFEKETLTFISSVNKSWRITTVFGAGLSNPGKATWFANGKTEDRGTIARESQLIAAAAGMVGPWKNTATEGDGKNERYVLNGDLTGEIVGWTKFNWTFQNNTLNLVSPNNDWRMDIAFNDGVTNPGKVMWHGQKTHDRGMIVRDGPAPSIAPVAPGPSPAGTTPGLNVPVSNRSLLLFRGHAQEGEVFSAIAKNIRMVGPDILADPNSFANASIVVFGGNQLHNIPGAAFTDSAQASLKRFVENGGDLVTCGNGEPRDRTEFFARLFGVRNTGGPVAGAVVEQPALRGRLSDAHLSDADLSKIVFTNGYEVPANATVLVRASHQNNDVPVAGFIPFGKGRVIFFGGGMAGPDLRFDEALFTSIFNSTSASDAASPTAHGGSEKSHPGRTIDLLPYFDANKGAVEGAWTIDHGTLASADAKGSWRIESSYRPPLEYDYIVEVTRPKGGDAVQLFSHGDAACGWHFGSAGETTSLQDVGGHGKNKTRAAIPAGLDDGKRHASMVQVRKTGVKTFIDGQLILDFPTDYSDLSPNKAWALRDEHFLGLGAFGPIVFNSVKVVEIGGAPESAIQPTASGANDLLAKVNLPADIVEGIWTRGPDGLTNPGDGRGARVRLLSNPPPEYDLRVVFTPHENHGSFGVLLAHNDASGMWKMDWPDNCRFRGAGDTAHMMPEKIASLDPKLTIGAKHEAIIKVRNDSISTFIDGKAMGRITEDYSQVRLEPYWSIGSHAIGLGNGGTGVTVHSVELSAASGSQSQYLSDIKDEKHACGQGQPLWTGAVAYNGLKIAVNNIAYPHSVAIHASKGSVSWATYKLDGKFKRFTSSVGIIDAAKSPPTLKFSVKADEKTVWESKSVSQGQPTQSCQIDIAGVNELQLLVWCDGDSNQGQAAWLDPQVSGANSESDNPATTVKPAKGGSIFDDPGTPAPRKP